MFSRHVHAVMLVIIPGVHKEIRPQIAHSHGHHGHHHEHIIDRGDMPSIE
jgi:hypothetical protein